ncbi:MAG: cellulase family glycosylhydrolase [Acidimicrobiales bacterium]|nr:cellulase family glycosylhydrolase [Acidimicrobiales bacterium]
MTASCPTKDPTTVRAASRLITASSIAVLSLVAFVAPSASTSVEAQPRRHQVATAADDVAAWSTAVGTDGRVWFADADGRSLTFRGFGNKTDHPATLFSDDLLAAGAERGFNLIRLSIWWDVLEPTQGTWNEAYLDEVETVLDRAETYGYHVIVANHQDRYGPAFGDHGAPEWATRTDGATFEPQPTWLLDYLQPAVQNAFEHLYEDADLRQAQIDMWLKIVDRVKDHPALFGYDLMNEPFGKIRDGEDLISAAKRVEAQQLTPMYQRLTDAIGAVDTDHWVFIEPPNLNALGIPTSLGHVDGPKVAVYPHMYNTQIESATYSPGGTFTYDPKFFESWKAAVVPYPKREQIPMLVGEWGVARPDYPGMDTFIAQSLATLDQATSSGWTMWAACFGGSYCTFDAAGNDRVGIDQVVAPYARAIAGAVTSTVWDPDARVLRVRYRDSDASGPTEVYVPEAKRYPEGFEVHVSGVDGPVDFDWDPDAGVASVAVADDGTDHAICVVPTGWEGECLAVDPVEEPATTTTSTVAPTDDGPTAAVPVPGAASYTG